MCQRHRSKCVPVASIGGEICGISDWIPHCLLIRNDDCCPRFNFVREFLGKVGVESDSRSQIFCSNGSAFATNAHPPARLASTCELTRLAATAFEQCKDVTAETTATTNINGRASDGVTIAVNVQRTIGRAKHNRDWPLGTALGAPVVIVLRESANH